MIHRIIASVRLTFGIDAGATVVGAIQVGHVIAKPSKVKNPIYLYQNMVVGDQTTDRSGDEKLQLSAFLPTQHRSLPSADKQSESEASGFFNSPRGIVSSRDGQVERMNRTTKEATLKRYHYDSHNQLRAHLADFIAAYNFARRLKTLSGLTPYEYICRIRTSSPDRFIVNPIHQMESTAKCGAIAVGSH